MAVSTSITGSASRAASDRSRSVNIRSRSSRLPSARPGSLVRPAICHRDPRLPNAARRKPGVGRSQTACPDSARSGRTSRGRSRKPSAITPGPGSLSKSSTISPKPSPRNQPNVSSMVSGDRLTQRSSMSMAANWLMNGLSDGTMRRAWSGITSSVAYRSRPYRSARRRATVDLPAPLPPPIQ